MQDHVTVILAMTWDPAWFLGLELLLLPGLGLSRGGVAPNVPTAISLSFPATLEAFAKAKHLLCPNIADIFRAFKLSSLIIP